MHVEEFLLYLAERRGKHKTRPSTRNTYLQNLKRLIKEAPSLDVESLRLLFQKLHDQGAKDSYINNLKVVLHLWGEFQGTEMYKVFKIDTVEASHKSTLSDSEIEAFLALPGSRKWWMFFRIMAYSGMRPGEVASLTTSSVDLGREVFLATGKSSDRLVPIAPSLLRDVTDYIKTLDDTRLFPGRGKGVLTRESWRLQFDKRISELGIVRSGLSCHSLRHSFITRLLGEDVNLFKIKKIVGHKKTETTEHYTHFVTKDMIQAIKKDPLARKSLTYYERFKFFREGVRKLLEDYAMTGEEERLMMQELFG